MSIYELTGHACFALVAASYLVKDILWLRVLAVAASVAGIAYNYFVPSPPLWLVIYWNILFLSINLYQIAAIVRERSGVSFTEEEKELYETLFGNFAPFEFMKLLRTGRWLTAERGALMATEGERLADVMLIYNGAVAVEVGGREVARLKDGSFIGEMSFISGGAATASVKALERTRYLCWSQAELRRLLNRNPSMHFAMQTILNTDLTKKLASADARAVKL
jgi:hypothetical protein